MNRTRETKGTKKKHEKKTRETEKKSTRNNAKDNIMIRLDDLFIRVQNLCIVNWESYTEKSDDSERAVFSTITREENPAKLFIRASNIFSYLDRTNNFCNTVTNIVIPGLRNIYWENREKLSETERRVLEVSMERKIPEFINVYEEYEYIKEYADNDFINRFQLLGSITPYDVVHIPTVYFVNLLNNRELINIELYPLDLILTLDYKEYMFWDYEYQKLITHIDISNC